MKRRTICFFFLLFVLLGSVQPDALSEKNENDISDEEYVLDLREKTTVSAAEENTVYFSVASGFYSTSIQVELSTSGGSDIHYTLDGSIPDAKSPLYIKPIHLNATKDSISVSVIRARAFDPNGNSSQVFTHSFFLGNDIESRFSMPVFSIVVEPQYFYGEPDGILLEDNLMMHGRNSEREAHVEVFTKDGTILLSQAAGIRIYGASSRYHDIKSFKLFARKHYDSEQRTFSIPFFETMDVAGVPLREYKRLVLRNSGNDDLHAFIRDEFVQCLAYQAGYQDYEGVFPVVTFLNGEYYALHWLHENYCDAYFQSKYGGKGEYCVIEGSETHMANSDPKDEAYEPMAESFNHTYYMFCGLDMNKQSNYEQVCGFMDVENYLDYYALNLFFGNYDWPNNNVKAYKFISDGKPSADKVQDGRWRFLPHDLDYSLGLYGEEHTAASYDHLADVLTEGNSRYSPMFTALMARADCREYFVDKMHALMQGTFSADNLLSVLEEMNTARYTELVNFYFPSLRSKGVGALEDLNLDMELASSMEQIHCFCEERGAFMEVFLADHFSSNEWVHE